MPSRSEPSDWEDDLDNDDDDDCLTWKDRLLDRLLTIAQIVFIVLLKAVCTS